MAKCHHRSIFALSSHVFGFDVRIHWHLLDLQYSRLCCNEWSSAQRLPGVEGKQRQTRHSSSSIPVSRYHSVSLEAAEIHKQLQVSYRALVIGLLLSMKLTCHARSPSTTKLAQRQLPSSSSSASPPPLQSFRKGQCIIGGLAVYAFTAYGTYLYKSYHLAVARSREIDIPDDVSNRYDNTADHFDSEVDTTEWITGITGLRSRLANKAYGNVLEVAAGTGRNLQYYPLEKCTSLTLVDLSERMLDRARDKFARQSDD